MKYYFIFKIQRAQYTLTRANGLWTMFPWEALRRVSQVLHFESTCNSKIGYLEVLIRSRRFSIRRLKVFTRFLMLPDDIRVMTAWGHLADAHLWKDTRRFAPWMLMAVNLWLNAVNLGGCRHFLSAEAFFCPGKPTTTINHRGVTIEYYRTSSHLRQTGASVYITFPLIDFSRFPIIRSTPV